jgi:hypothetical protein
MCAAPTQQEPHHQVAHCCCSSLLISACLARQATTCKANHHGVVLEAVVQLGRVRHVSRAGNWGSRLRQQLLRYDSVALTFLEGGIEYVVYQPERVSSIRVHKVLHPCSSSGGLSVDSSSSSFQISTALDPGCDGNGGRSSGSSSSSCSGHSAEPWCSSGGSVCSELQLGPTATGLTEASRSSFGSLLSAVAGSRQCSEEDGREGCCQEEVAHSRLGLCCPGCGSGSGSREARHCCCHKQQNQQQPCHHGPVADQQQPQPARQEARAQPPSAISSTQESLSHMLVFVNEAMQAAGSSSGDKTMVHSSSSNSSLRACKQLVVA